MEERLTHIDARGEVRMVDVGDKPETLRTATATGQLRMRAETLQLALSGANKKGNVQTVAEIAGVMGAKRTADLIPLCHPLSLSKIEVVVTADAMLPGFRVRATARVTGKTGVEMEALTAVSVACLTLYDMLKAADRDMRIEDITLVEKTGGASRNHRATDAGPVG